MNIFDDNGAQFNPSDPLPLLGSFSGGRTSALMVKFMEEYPPFKNRKKVYCFANTGVEFEATLRFVDECDRRWNLGVVWLEAIVHPEKGMGTTFKVVTFETASRDGEPFEAVIKKYGIPNKNFPHCTRELKQKPIKKYMQSLGYSDWVTAVGIRADEPSRLNRSDDVNFVRPFFPFADIIKADEAFVRDWWGKNDFDLALKDYQSNCKLCWKKSKRKKLTLIDDDPSVADWWQKMEETYDDGYIFDQRDGNTIEDLVKMAQNPFSRYIDKQEQREGNPQLFEPEMDVEWACMCNSSM